MSKIWLTLCVALLAPLMAGCGESGPELAPVKGKITVNGEPIEKVRVEYHTQTDGPNSAALTDADGNYELTIVGEDTKGAVVGKHKVVVIDVGVVTKFVGRAEDVDITGGKKRRTHSKYSNVMLTPLEATVNSGENPEINFDIEPYEG